ncbi:hypothetical protein UFOVP1229_61 [uncultured Caudovirales phage]|uniref:Uncharacterized protein n=1 Tax=uncultured Caudovirales phage TaxID=2100421 RepID=A0A6J5RDS4_9CAUD|nr:hypothetical protein UFOVP1229_61 [uncultured Caudovirales phage]
MAVKRPSFQFYPGDWLRSTDLRSCSISARGLWIDMICLMHEGAEYGHLKVGTKVILPPNLARMVGATLEETEGWLDELVSAGVVSIDESGCYVCRRMVKDEQTRASRAAGGSKGGNPALKTPHKDIHDATPKVGEKDNLPVNLRPTPSSASSSASAEFKETHTASSRDQVLADSLTMPCGPSPAFNQFMAVYPLPVYPNEAWRAWQGEVASIVIEQSVTDAFAESFLLAAAKEYAASPSGQDSLTPPDDYRPSPAKWLSGGKYKEDRSLWDKPNSKSGKRAVKKDVAIAATNQEFEDFMKSQMEKSQ